MADGVYGTNRESTQADLYQQISDEDRRLAEIRNKIDSGGGGMSLSQGIAMALGSILPIVGGYALDKNRGAALGAKVGTNFGTGYSSLLDQNEAQNASRLQNDYNSALKSKSDLVKQNNELAKMGFATDEKIALEKQIAPYKQANARATGAGLAQALGKGYGVEAPAAYTPSVGGIDATQVELKPGDKVEEITVSDEDAPKLDAIVKQVKPDGDASRAPADIQEKLKAISQGKDVTLTEEDIAKIPSRLAATKEAADVQNKVNQTYKAGNDLRGELDSSKEATNYLDKEAKFRALIPTFENKGAESDAVFLKQAIGVIENGVVQGNEAKAIAESDTLPASLKAEVLSVIKGTSRMSPQLRQVIFEAAKNQTNAAALQFRRRAEGLSSVAKGQGQDPGAVNVLGKIKDGSEIYNEYMNPPEMQVKGGQLVPTGKRNRTTRKPVFLDQTSGKYVEME